MQAFCGGISYISYIKTGISVTCKNSVYDSRVKYAHRKLTKPEPSETQVREVEAKRIFYANECHGYMYQEQGINNQSFLFFNPCTVCCCSPY